MALGFNVALWSLGAEVSVRSAAEVPPASLHFPDVPRRGLSGDHFPV